MVNWNITYLDQVRTVNNFIQTSITNFNRNQEKEVNLFLNNYKQIQSELESQASALIKININGPFGKKNEIVNNNNNNCNIKK